MTTDLFLYGSLQRGCSNHLHLTGQHFVGEVRTEPCYRLYELDGYPGMVFDESRGLSIPGELWSVDADCLARLDRFEGVHELLYARIPVLLDWPARSGRECTYLYLRELTGLQELVRWEPAGGVPR